MGGTKLGDLTVRKNSETPQRKEQEVADLSVSDMAASEQTEMVSAGEPIADQPKTAEFTPAPTRKAKPAVPLFSANGTSSKPPTSGEGLPKPGASQSAASKHCMCSIVWQ